MTAEAVKKCLREYADQEFGQTWDAASVMVTLPGRQPETLVIVRGPDGNDPPGGDPPATPPRR